MLLLLKTKNGFNYRLMTQEELRNVFKYIVKKCDMLINDDCYEADAYTQDTVEDIAELFNHILDGDYGKLVEVKEVDLEKESELIANGIMISVQSNKYGTNVYNTERNDFNHYHLQMAARKGIELGLKAQKGE